MSTTQLADEAVTPTDLLSELTAARSIADAAEVDVLRIAVEWAHAHPVPEGTEGWRPWKTGPDTAIPMGVFDATVADLDLSDPDAEEKFAWAGIPPVAWQAPAAFAAANKMSTYAGKCLLRDGLILAHRLPLTWARTLAGEVPAWRARRIAQAVLGAPADVCAYVDDEVAHQAGSIGTRGLDGIIEAAMLALHAEAFEADQACAGDLHEVTVGDADHTGTADLHARGEWKDLHDFERTVAEIAEALRLQGDEDPLGQRRAKAMGILADPALAAALLTPDPTATAAKPAPRKRAVVYLHLTDLALLGVDPVAHNETTRRAVLTAAVHQWLQRDDTHVTVRPVLDLDEHIHTEAYAVPDRLREQAGLIHQTCTFPWCAMPARVCDRDHLEPWSVDPGGGPTCSCNIVPLCRHHHRLKTHAGWRYRRLDTRLFLWTDPHGRHYLRDCARTTVVEHSPPPSLAAQPDSG